jgi:hypothetical protein
MLKRHGNLERSKFLNIDKHGACVHRQSVEADARLYGKFVLTPDTELSASQVAPTHKSVRRVDRSLRDQKSPLELHPVELNVHRICPLLSAPNSSLIMLDDTIYEDVRSSLTRPSTTTERPSTRTVSSDDVTSSSTKPSWEVSSTLCHDSPSFTAGNTKDSGS